MNPAEYYQGRRPAGARTRREFASLRERVSVALCGQPDSIPLASALEQIERFKNATKIPAMPPNGFNRTAASDSYHLIAACSTDYRPRPICPPGKWKRWQTIAGMNRDQLRALVRQQRPAWEIKTARRLLEK